MKKETLEYLLDLVAEEHHKEKQEEFGGVYEYRAREWEKAKTARLLELEAIMEELTTEINK